MADFSELRAILDYRTLTEKYEEYGRNTAPNPFYDFYTGGAQKQFDQDEVEFITLSRVKDPAPFNTRGNPARVLNTTGKGRRKLQLLNQFNMVKLGLSAVQMLRAPDQWSLQRKGKEEIQQQIEDFAIRHVYTWQVYVSKYMQGATVYINADGDICESDPSSGFQVATGIPSSNLTYIAKSGFGMGSGNIIDLPWDNPDAKILDQLDLICEACEYANLPPIRHIWLHRSNKIWLRANNQIMEFYTAGMERLDNALKGDTFEINNYTFHFFGGTYTASDDTTGYFIPKTKAVMTPEPTDSNWLVNGVGMQYVPTSLDMSGTVEEALAKWDERYGDFSYVLPDLHDMSLNLYTGTNRLFGLRNPACVFVPTVDF